MKNVIEFTEQSWELIWLIGLVFGLVCFVVFWLWLEWAHARKVSRRGREEREARLRRTGMMK